MTAFEIEEKIDVLSGMLNSIDTSISYLEEISLNDSSYNLYLAELVEFGRNLQTDLNNLYEQLNNYSIEEIYSAQLEQLKKLQEK